MSRNAVAQARQAPHDVLAGIVERVTFHNDESGFCVLRVKARGHRDLVTVVGHSAAIAAGEWITATGDWFNDRTHGLQFKARFLKTTPPTTAEGIEKYLSSGMIRGIGPVYAKKMVKAFGEQVFDIIEANPERLREVDGIGVVRAQRITAAWAEQKAVREIMVFLHSHGVGTARAVRIYKTYGADAIQVMTDNPYRLARDIRGIGFRTADAIAMKLGIEKSAMIRVRAGISYALTEAMDQGHCGRPAEELGPLAVDLLDVPKELIQTALELELSEGTVIADAVGETRCVFLAGLYRSEQAIAERLRILATGKLPWAWIDPEKAMPWIEQKTGLSLAPTQMEAIRLALMAKVLVITGGPGVGKTTIVNSILRILAAKGVNLLLCAPTGRAAKRMTEAKSSEEGLDMEFNSLEAQREACEAYVASQKAEGWAAIRERYDDGGFSGGNLERPALKQLIADIEAGLIDVIVVYKIDRLSRSLMDFAKLVEVFDRSSVTFVSVTQSFNTTTSMGRLTLNILLSFAQFEREVIGERIRDKFAASRKRGMWMGGFVPMGYDVKDRKLVVNDAEARTVRMIFERFAALGSASTLARALQAEDVRNKRGKRIDKGFIYKLINSRVYLGEAVHKGTSYPGEHNGIITPELWDRVHAILKESPRQRRAKNRSSSEALLKGIIFTDTGAAMTPTYTRKGERLYHYYTSMDLIRNRDSRGGEGPMRLAAAMVDGAVIAEMRRIIRAPEVVARVIEVQRGEGPPMDEREIVTELQRFNDLWDALFPSEQARIVRLLIDRVTVGPIGMAVDLRNNGIATLIRDLNASTNRGAAA